MNKLIKENIIKSNYSNLEKEIYFLLELIKIHNSNYEKYDIILNNNYLKKISNARLTISDSINNTNFTNLLCNLINIQGQFNYIYDKNNNLFNNVFINIKKNNLLKDGYTIINNVLTNKQCENIINLLNNNIYFNKVIKEENNINLFSNNNYGIWWLKNTNNIYNIDYIQDFLSNEYLLEVIQNYLGTTPIFFSTNFWASYPSKTEQTQKFHQDFDDIKFLKIFIYLNNVNNDNGPHVYVKKSLNDIIDKKLLENYVQGSRIDDITIENINNNNIINIIGEHGTVIIENTKGLHKGLNVIKDKRFILQFLFGVSPLYYYKSHNYKKIILDKTICNKLYLAKQKYPYIYQNFIFK